MAHNSAFVTFHLTHRLCMVGLLAALAVGCTMDPAPTRVDDGIAIHNVSVIDVAGASFTPGMTVTVREDRIVHVLPSHEMELGADVRTVDGSGRFLIPGLWDMHVHLQGTASDVERVEFPVYLAHGITGIRLMAGCDPEYVANRPDAKPCMSDTSSGSPSVAQVQSWRERIANLSIVGPRIVAASMMFDGPRLCYQAYALENADEARARVRNAVTSGVDFLKLFNCSLSPELYHAIAAEARNLGVVLAGHVPGRVSLIEAVVAGQKDIEHAGPSLLEACSSPKDVVFARDAFSTGGFAAYLKALVDAFEPAACEGLVEAMITHGAALGPTFLVNTNNVVNIDLRAAVETDERVRYLVPQTRETWEAEIDNQTLDEATRTLYASYFEKLYSAVAILDQRGVPLLAGSDSPNLLVFPGAGLHDELGFLVRAGLTPASALAAATTTPAWYLGREAELGTIAPGREADLVLLDANPLEDISNTRKIHVVMARGRLFDRLALDDLLQEAALAARRLPGAN